VLLARYVKPPKPPVLWLRGADDVIVSDHSLYDLADLPRRTVRPAFPCLT
jgi:hypothetical protein